MHEFGGNRDPHQYAQEVLDHSQEVLGRAVEVVSPHNPNADPLEVFPASGERRADDVGLVLSSEQEQDLRSIAAELGFGRLADQTPSELGLYGACMVLEGGQAHKTLAEAGLVLDDAGTTPSMLVFSASGHRRVGDAEAETTSRILGVPVEQVGETEYDVAAQVASHLPGYEGLAQPEVLPWGYDINDGFSLTEGPSGQLVRVGTIGDIPVVLLRVDRQDYVDDATGKPRYRNQPGTAEVIGIVDAVQRDRGDIDTPIAFVTSSTYEASRLPDAMCASLTTGRIVGVPTYGAQRLAEVKGEPLPAPAPINQLPGEFNRMAAQVKKLAEVLDRE